MALTCGRIWARRVRYLVAADAALTWAMRTLWVPSSFKDNVVAAAGQYGEAFDGSVAAQDFDALVDDFCGPARRCGLC